MVSQSRFSSYFSYYKVNLILSYDEGPLYSFFENCLFVSFALSIYFLVFFFNFDCKSSFYIRHIVV